MVVTVIDIGGDACGGVGGPGGGFGGPEGGFSDSRGSGKPLLLLRLKKPPSGPPKPLPGPPGPPRGSFYELSFMGCKSFSEELVGRW